MNWTDNSTNTSELWPDPDLTPIRRTAYFYLVVLLVAFCTLSACINTVILMSICWIRRPITPTLHLSLSLAGSDLFTLLLAGITLIFNSLLPVCFNLKLLGDCYLLFLEALRMGGFSTTLCHLLALTINHYIGITKPFHYPSIMTHRNISLLALLLWLLPPSIFLIYFHLIEDDGFSSPGCTYKFMLKHEFRRYCSSVYFGCVGIMALIYIHIYLLVRRHQANRNKFRRAGSTYSRNAQVSDQQQYRNEKALCTTLLIVGTTVVGWLPVTLNFYLVCEDCFIQRDWKPELANLLANALFNFLLFLKNALNSYIYAARMHEIKVAMRRMRHRLKQVCCGMAMTELNGLSESRQLHSRSSVSRRSRRTVLCRVQSARQGSGTTQL